VDDLDDGVTLTSLRQLDRLAAGGQRPSLLDEHVAGRRRHEQDVVDPRGWLRLRLNARSRLELHAGCRLGRALDGRLETVQARLDSLEQIVEAPSRVVPCGHASIVADLR